MLRYRGKKSAAINLVKQFDSFPKVQEEIYEPSTYSNITCMINIKLCLFYVLVLSICLLKHFY